jgi:hypothetical protein
MNLPISGKPEIGWPKRFHGHVRACILRDVLLRSSSYAALLRMRVECMTVTYATSVSMNRIGSPVDGVTNSPCHITRLPRR